MAKNTRLATTITARFLPENGAVDAFYLDGRMNGRREEYFADITLDREDQGSFFAVYASAHGSTRPVEGGDGNFNSLGKISQLLKAPKNNIDQVINELAETAVNVTGRLTLSDNNEVKPYFAGIIVKDGEMAAVTTGRGCAYLYRDDALFPLTRDGLNFEAVDYYGKSLPNMDDFAAGVAGTLHYSNIAQMKPNDCLIICNREVMETIGQKRMLQLLDQAEDQCDAAGMVMGLVTHELSRGSMQFMISFVEDVIPLDKLGRSTLARGFAKLARDTGLFKAQADAGEAAQDLHSSVQQQISRKKYENIIAEQPPLHSFDGEAERGAQITGTAGIGPSAAQENVEQKDEGIAEKVPVSDLIEDMENEDFLADSPKGVSDIVSRLSEKPDTNIRSEQDVSKDKTSETDSDNVFSPEILSNSIIKTDSQTKDKVSGKYSDAEAETTPAKDEDSFSEEISQPGASDGKNTDSGKPLSENAAEASDKEAKAEKPKKSGHPKAAPALVSPKEKRTAKIKDTFPEYADKKPILGRVVLFALVLIAAIFLVFVIYKFIAPEDSLIGGNKTSESGSDVISSDLNKSSESQTLPKITQPPTMPQSETAPPTVKGTKAANKPGGDYTVGGGDTLLSIIQRVYNCNEAQAYDILPEVEKANPDMDAAFLSVGDVIHLPKINESQPGSTE